MIEAIVIEQHGDASQLKLQQLAEPQPGPGQVLIRTHLTSVNFADIQARRGNYDAGKTPPFIPGLDCVGTVEALGDGVRGIKVGTRVAAFPSTGSYATHVVAPITLVYLVPEELPDEAVVGLTVLLTAYNTLTLAGRLTPGEAVLIQAAAGGVGSTAIQMARALHAGQVIGTVGSEEKRGFVSQLGADTVINYREHEEFAPAVLEATGGGGADLILDSVGGSVLDQSVTCLAPFGRLVAFGQSSGRPADIRSSLLHRQNRAIIGYSSGHYRKFRPETLRPSVAAVFQLLLSGSVQVQVGARFPLKDARAAHELVERRESTGKVLLNPQQQ